MKLIFVSKSNETNNTYLFWFKPIKSISWLAGQSIRLEINGHERRFSIVSAPYERNIAIATRISNSDFKQALNNLSPGDEIDGFNIEGSFLWQESSGKKVLMASGIGITPYISMLKQLHHDRRQINALLIYANRDDQFLFGKELRQLQTDHPKLQIEFLAAQRLSQKTIHTIFSSFPRFDLVSDKIMVYLSGPEAMVNNMTSLLFAAGVKKLA